MRALLSALCLAGCAQAQDLGGVDPSSANGGLDRALPPGVTLDACPLEAPTGGGTCTLRTGFCSYRVGDDTGLDRWCTCAVGGRWSCFVARNARSTAPIESLPLDTVACAEGAPCAGNVTCSVGMDRACRCTSAGRMLCQTVVAR